MFRVESPVQIEEPQQFFEKYLAKIIKALDEYLLEEYGEWFGQFNLDQQDDTGAQANDGRGPAGRAPSQARSPLVNLLDGEMSSPEHLVKYHE